MTDLDLYTPPNSVGEKISFRNILGKVILLRGSVMGRSYCTIQLEASHYGHTIIEFPKTGIWFGQQQQSVLVEFADGEAVVIPEINSEVFNSLQSEARMSIVRINGISAAFYDMGELEIQAELERMRKAKSSKNVFYVKNIEDHIYVDKVLDSGAIAGNSFIEKIQGFDNISDAVNLLNQIKEKGAGQKDIQRMTSDRASIFQWNKIVERQYAVVYNDGKIEVKIKTAI